MRLRGTPKTALAITKRDPRDDGAQCDRCPFKGQTPVFSSYSQDPKLIVVGQDPGFNEVEQGMVFVGRSGKRLNKVLQRFNIPRSSLHIANARLCKPPPKMRQSDLKLALECCRPRLSRELQALPSSLNVILALGGAAMQSVTGKKHILGRMGGPMKGAEFSFKERVNKKGVTVGHPPSFNADFTRFDVLPAAHPAMVLRQPHMGFVMTIHIGRAWSLQLGTLKPWKWPKLHVHPGFPMVKALERIVTSSRYVSVDLETGGTHFKYSPVRVVGISNGRDTVAIPWEAYSSKKYGTAKGLKEYPDGFLIRELVYKILHTKRLVGQNFAYDLLMAKYQMGFDVRRQYWFDTLLAHRIIAPRLPHRLGFIATIEFHCPNWKIEFGDATEKKGLAKFFERPEEELRIYCAKDSLMTWKLVKPCMKRLGVTEKQLDELWKQQRRSVA